MVEVMAALDVREGLAAVDAAEDAHGRDPDDVLVLGIDGESAEVPGTLAEVVRAIGAGPGFAAVVRAVEAALLVLDHGVHAMAVGRGDGYADLAPGALGKALAPVLFAGVLVVELLPAFAAVA